MCFFCKLDAPFQSFPLQNLSLWQWFIQGNFSATPTQDPLCFYSFEIGWTATHLAWPSPSIKRASSKKNSRFDDLFIIILCTISDVHGTTSMPSRSPIGWLKQKRAWGMVTSWFRVNLAAFPEVNCIKLHEEHYKVCLKKWRPISLTLECPSSSADTGLLCREDLPVNGDSTRTNSHTPLVRAGPR